MPWVGTTPPEKGFFIKGQLIQRDEAPELYEFALNNNLIKSEEEWQEQKLYGFYSDGDGQTTFRLPLYTGYKFIGYDETQHILGKPLEPAVPNVKGTYRSAYQLYGSASGAMMALKVSGSRVQVHSDSILAESALDYDASRSSSVYKDTCNTVQTPDIPQNYVVKYKL